MKKLKQIVTALVSVILTGTVTVNASATVLIFRMFPFNYP